MAASTSGTNSLKEYLKRYESSTEVEKKKKKKRKKPRHDSGGVLVVDEDPVWQKPVNVEEDENDDDLPEETNPQIEEDIEVRRQKRLEQIRARRPYNSIAEDGSGWVPLPTKRSDEEVPDSSPPRKQRIRNDTPSPEPESRAMHSSAPKFDISPPRRRRVREDTPSPEPESRAMHSNAPKVDISPPRRRRVREDTPSPEIKGKEDDYLSPPRQRRRNFETDISPPRRNNRSQHSDNTHASDLSPPRRKNRSQNLDKAHASDLSPPRRSRKGSDKQSSPSRVSRQRSPDIDLAPDISPPRKSKQDLSIPSASKVQPPKRGLVSGKDTSREMAKTKKEEMLRFQAMDPSMTGRDATPIFRDKRTGRRLEKEEMLKAQEEEKPKEKKLEWGKGLAQKRQVEERLRELELEKEKPFAQTRDDPELDNMLKDRVRWGDPMAHLVKKKSMEAGLANFGDNEKMKESGFKIPQEVPNHSWMKRGLDAAPNRYGIKPGRHWDGVDRSTGYEKQLFNRTNEKQATDREAYLWSVADM